MMAFPVDRDYEIKYWQPFPQRIFFAEMKSRINWPVFWACWSIGTGRHLLSIRTPWFIVMISTGTLEWNWFGAWRGVRAHWKHVKGWQIQEGGLLFHNGDDFLSWPCPTLFEEKACQI